MTLTKDYYLKGIDNGVWNEFKAACAHYNISIRQTFIRHIYNIVNDYRAYKSGFTNTIIYKERKPKL